MNYSFRKNGIGSDDASPRFKWRKKVDKKKQVRISIIPPKIKNLPVKNIWSILRKNADLLRYFPDHSVEEETPRNYLISVISAIGPEIINDYLR